MTRLIEDSGDDVQPAWSRDNTKIAWSAKNGIRIANADGSDASSSRTVARRTASRSGRHDKLIVFGSSRDGDFDLYTRHVGKDDLTALTKNSVDDYDPSWSTVTDRIAFVSARGEDRDIWTMDPDGGGLAQLTGNEGQEDDPAWSPDGSKIAFSSDREGGTFFVYVMNADGSDIVRLSTGPPASTTRRGRPTAASSRSPGPATRRSWRSSTSRRTRTSARSRPTARTRVRGLAGPLTLADGLPRRNRRLR